MKIKLICGIILACMLLCTMIGCQTSGSDAITTEVATTQVPETEKPPMAIKLAELNNYILIRPEETDDTTIKAATDLLKAINTACGTSVRIKTDFYREGMKGYQIIDQEILIGSTSRPQTAAFLATLRADDYGYGVVDGKLVIAGHNSATTAKAVQLFCNHVLTADAATRADFFVEGEGKINIGKYPLDTLTLCGKPIHEFSILYPKESQNFEKQLAKLLADHIASVCGYVLTVEAGELTDAAGKICIGSAFSRSPVTSGQYLMGADAATVLACGADSVGNAAAVHALIDALTPTNGKKTHDCVLNAPEATKIEDTTHTNKIP